MVRDLVTRRIDVDRILKPVVYFLAAMYFLVDAIFLTVAKSLANWVTAHWISERLRLWIVELRPLSHACILRFACGCPRAGQTNGGIFNRYGSRRNRHCQFNHRRNFEACVGRTSFQR
jgi:hypothetical protein